MSHFKQQLETYAKLTEDWISNNINEYSAYTAKLTEGMRYSLMAGGKRIRPAIMYASSSLFIDDLSIVAPFASSIEILHTYSLIHDDLPAMDDDDLRRGKPTNHIVFGEAEAILAGDALLTKAFEIISSRTYTPHVSDKVRVDAINLLAECSGDKGMVAGQYLDIISNGITTTIDELEFIHKHKTAELIRYCSVMGAVIAEKMESDDFDRLSKYGSNIGIAFQIFDDVLDVTSTTEQLGKPIGSDDINNKITYTTVYGVDKSIKIAKQLVDEAVECISIYDKKGKPLTDIALMVVERKS